MLYQLKVKIHDETQIIPLLNGIDIYERIRKIIQKGYIYPACVYIGTYISEPGVICKNGGQCKIIYGKDYQRKDATPHIIMQTFERAKINAVFSDSYREAIWEKYMCIASYALVTAAYNKTMGEVYEDGKLSEKLKGIMNIIYKLAIKEKVYLSDNCVENADNKALDFPYDTKTSF